METFLRRKCEQEINCFRVDCWGEDVPGVGPLLVAEGNGTSLVFGSSFHGVELEFEVHLAWDSPVLFG